MLITCISYKMCLGSKINYLTQMPVSIFSVIIILFLMLLIIAPLFLSFFPSLVDRAGSGCHGGDFHCV